MTVSAPSQQRPRRDPATHPLSAQLSISRETTVDEVTADRFWQVYSDSFTPLRTLAAARHMLREDEFHTEIRDERVVKFVGRDRDGLAWGMTTLTRDLTTIPWIEPEFYRHRFEQYAQRDALFYNGFTAIHSDAQGSTCFPMLMRELMGEVFAVNGVLCTDMCGYNIDVVAFLGGVRRLAESVGAVIEHELDVQKYYAFELLQRRTS